MRYGRDHRETQVAVRVTRRVHGNNAMPSVRSHGAWRDEAMRALPSRMLGDGAAVTETSGKGCCFRGYNEVLSVSRTERGRSKSCSAASYVAAGAVEPAEVVTDASGSGCSGSCYSS